MSSVNCKLIVGICIFLLMITGCADEISDYESYFPNTEIEFDNVSYEGDIYDVGFIEQENSSVISDINYDDIQEDVYYSPALPTFSHDSSQIEESHDNIVYSGENVWIPKSGKKYHCKPDCSNMKSPSEVSMEFAIQEGYEPCKRCFK